MPIRREVNKSFFKKWTSNMAYILGFIFADGNITCTKRGTWYWSLQITDIEILKKIKKDIGSSHIISKKKSKQKHKQIYRLQIGSKEMCDDLIFLGLIERKSKIMLFPEIPKKYFSDFLRGYFDGDGGVWVGLKNKKQNNKNYIISTFFTSGSEDFLISLKKILFSSGVLGGCLVKKERGFDLKYSIKNSLKLYKIMYNSKCDLFLKRKREKFENYISMRS